MKKKKTFKSRLIYLFYFILFLLVSIAIAINLKSKNETREGYESRFEIENLANESLYYSKNNIKISTNDLKYNTVDDNLLHLNIQSENEIDKINNINIYLNSNLIKKDSIINGTTNQIEIPIEKEGKQDLKIELLNEENVIDSFNAYFYYIKPYEHQFLENYSTKGISTHFCRNAKYQDDDKSLYLIKKMGAFNIRTDYDLERLDKNLNYNYINELTNSNINVIGILGGIPQKYSGSDHVINSDKELEDTLQIMQRSINECPNVKEFEWINEPNSKNKYGSDENFNWYVKALKEINNILSKDSKRVIAGALAGVEDESEYKDLYMNTSTFINNLFIDDGMDKINSISFHKYGSDKFFYDFSNKINKVNNSNGGFNYLLETEYGTTTTTQSEDYQASHQIRQAVLLDDTNIEKSFLYCFKDTTKKEDKGQKFGLIDYDGNLKASYYSIKEFFTNTNGAEYIGSFSLSDGINAYIYDKDGLPKAIIWSIDGEKKISYTNFIASDIYGNEIYPDENNLLTVSNSPIYLNNVPKNFFYKAISNTIINRLNDFETNYSNEILNIEGLQQKIEEEKNYIKNIETVNDIEEDISIDRMFSLYEIGNIIIDEYNKGKLNIEAIQCSSILDELNTIGKSYEDLVTVSAKSRNIHFNNVDKNIDENLLDELNYYNSIKNIIDSLDSKEAIYSSKILSFAKDYYDKSSYINSITEENPIKTGLIVSKNLHSYLLLNWAEKFSNIQYNNSEDIVESINYSTKEPTNQDVTVSINTNREIQEVQDWELSRDKKSISKTYKENKMENIILKDNFGNETIVDINVNNIDKEKPEIITRERINNKANEISLIINIKDSSEIAKLLINEKEEKLDNNNKIELKLTSNQEVKIIATDKAGNTFELIQNIERIDEIAPVIENVEDNKKYKESVTPIIYDNKSENENQIVSGIKEVILKKNDSIVNYSMGDTIFTPGEYELTVEDLAEHKTIKRFTIIKEEQVGDINGDGKTDIIDLALLNKHISRKKELNSRELENADINKDNLVDIVDLAALNKIMFDRNRLYEPSITYNNTNINNAISNSINNNIYNNTNNNKYIINTDGLNIIF